MNRFLISILIAVAAAACTDHDQFRISGTIEEEPTMNIRVGYYADGVYRTLITVSEKGAFEFYGSSRQPTVVEIYDYEYRLLGRVYAANGQTLDVKLARSNPYDLSVDGNETAKAWADFLRANADSLRADNAKANDIIGRYIAANPASTVSTLLLLTSFDSAAEPLMADSLLGLIAPEARPSVLTDGYNYLLQRVVAETADEPVLPFRYMTRTDSVRSFKPADSRISLIAVSDENSKRLDSILPALRRLYKKNGKNKVALIDLSVDSDSRDWKHSVSPDSAKWEQGWTPGGIASPGLERLAIPSVPYFIVCDSTGTQLYRGASVGAAEAYISSIQK